MHPIIAISLGLLVLVLTVVHEYIEAHYVVSIANRRAGLASVYSVSMGMVSIVGWLAILDISKWYLIPEILGWAIGPWIAVRRMVKGNQRL